MGLFKKSNDKSHKRRSLNEWILIGFFTLVALQVVAWITGEIFGKTLYLGPGFLLIGIAIAFISTLAVAIGVLKKQPIDKKDIVAIIIILGVTILAVLYLRPLVPEIFEPGSMALKTMVQSIIPIP